MTELISTFNFTGIVIGIVTFLIIGLFHPLVIKAEYYIGVRCWWVFLTAGIVFVILSLIINEIMISSFMGIIAFSCFWSILELFHQKKRVEKGWFPANPKRKK